MISIMKDNFKRILKPIAISLLWLLIWQLTAVLINNQLLIPTPFETVKALITLCKTSAFYIAVLKSLLRIIIGFTGGVIVGFLGALLSTKSKLFSDLTKPALQVIKAVPVASFIILAFFWFESDKLPIFISFLMVLPMIWATTETELLGIDKNYLELARVYNLKPLKVFFSVKLPFIMPAFLSTALTALGFAWKSGIAAEVICRPRFSLGTLLDQNKTYLEIPSVFALTVVVALLSIILEVILKKAVRRFLNAKN